MALVGSINFLLGMESSKFTAGTNRALKDLNRLEAGAKAIRRTFSTAFGALGIGVGISELIGFLRNAHQEAQQAAEAQRHLNAVLEATGHAAGLSASAINDHAQQLSKLSGVDDDLIASSQALLLQFKRVQGDVFQRGAELALDMSRAMGKDLNSAILTVGKSLNDPVRGIALLHRVGIDFSDDQEQMIRQMMEMGQVAKAQGVILAGLATTFGGAAKKMRDEWKALSVAWGNFLQTIGELGTGSGTGRGFADDMAEGLNELGNELKFISDVLNDDTLSGFERLKKILTDLGNIEADMATLLTPEEDRALREAERRQGIQEESNRINSRQRQGMLGGDNFGNDPVGRALSQDRRLAIQDFLRPDRMLGGLDAATMHAIDSAIESSRQSDIGMDEPEIRDRQFAGAAMRGSEEAFSTIAAFQGSRGPERAEQQRERQIKALEKIEQNTINNVLEIELQPIA